MHPNHLRTPRRGERGTAIVFATAVIILIASLSLALSHLDVASWKQTRDITDRTRVEYAAEAGLNEAQAILAKSGKTGLDAVTYPRTLRGTDYWCLATYGDVDAALGDDLVRIVCVAEGGGRRAAVDGLFRRVNTIVTGAVGATQLRLRSNTIVDSYDSRLGTYAAQMVNYAYGDDYALTGAKTGSNGQITLDSGAVIFGDAAPGPANSVSLGPNSYVTGAAAPAAAATALAPVVVPAIAVAGTINLSGSTTQTLPPGDYGKTSVSLDSDAVLTIRGPARLRTGALTVDSNARLVADTSGGPVEIFCTGAFSLDSNAVVTTANGKARGFVVSCSSAAPVTLNSNARLTAVLYAPSAPYSSESNSEAFGAVVAERIEVRGNSEIHLDEALDVPVVTAPGPLTRLSWLALSEKQALAIPRP